MYDTAGCLPGAPLAAGTRLLCSGPPMSGKRSLLFDLLAVGVEAGEAVVVVTTDITAWNLFAAVPALDHDRVAVVDTTGRATDDDRVTVVNSPSDLTGLAIAVTEALTAFEQQGHRVRVGLDSLSTLRVYSDDKRLYRFFHVLTQQVKNASGLFACTAHDDAMSGLLNTLFDAHAELRVEEGTTTCQLRTPDTTTDWTPVDLPELLPVEPERRIHAISVRSFQHVRDVLVGDGLTLTVCNPRLGESDVAAVRAFFERLAVTVVEREVEGFPNSLALLHRGVEFLAADQLVQVAGAVTIEEAMLRREAIPAVVRRAQRSVHGDPVADHEALVRVSRQFEIEAGRAGVGRVHAGFRRLSRVTADGSTWGLYRALADAGVDVHIYGEPDAELPAHPGITVHTDITEELADTWFVVFDGPTGGALLAEVIEDEEPITDARDERYDAVWTRRSDVVDGLVDYLEKQRS